MSSKIIESLSAFAILIMFIFVMLWFENGVSRGLDMHLSEVRSAEKRELIADINDLKRGRVKNVLAEKRAELKRINH